MVVNTSLPQTHPDDPFSRGPGLGNGIPALAGSVSGCLGAPRPRKVVARVSARVDGRARAADGAVASRGRRNPGESLWLICEERANGERKYHLSNHPDDVSRETLAASGKARWVCEQAHQQMKQELGLDHYEGRSWFGLRHHCLLTMISFAFPQHPRLAGKKTPPGQAAASPHAPRSAARADPGAVGKNAVSILRENHPAEPENLNVAK